jgi:hypothetical protein
MKQIIHAIVNWLHPHDVIYYGPYRCGNCNTMICRASLEQGGAMFEYPDTTEIIYPNTAWRRHGCFHDRTGGGQF